MQAHTPISFSRIPNSYQADLLPPVNEWHWVATIGHNTEPPIHTTKHKRWIDNKENLHSPAHREVMLTLIGDTIFNLNDKFYPRKPGYIFLFDHYESRAFRGLNPPKSYSCLWLHLNSRHFLTYNTVSLNKNRQQSREIPNGRLKSGDTPRLIMEAWDYCKDHPESKPAWELLKSLIAATCLEILATSESSRNPNHHQQIISVILKHIRSHPDEDLSLQRLAEMAGYSTFFFHRMFQQHTGQTPKHYIDMVRLEKAKELLKQNHTVESVSEAVGMASASHLGVFFKKYMRRSPGQWRDAELS